jgi:hypothetical protein
MVMGLIIGRSWAKVKKTLAGKKGLTLLLRKRNIKSGAKRQTRAAPPYN